MAQVLLLHPLRFLKARAPHVDSKPSYGTLPFMHWQRRKRAVQQKLFGHWHMHGDLQDLDRAASVYCLNR
ncbi:hypothetical protein CA264_11715 [Pontibacter actiniarum]|uniref:Uncharacterized protein n=1 Tax=Pontibacter actiniarum TaxID=323450 RepID=A0A1X9YT63_9BACT|nr:hypothetical protein CA264_11715 [Pontibacter actiniarum]